MTKKKLVVSGAVIVLLSMTVLGIQARRGLAFLSAREESIKNALRSAPPGTLQSNLRDGARRFVETGELVFELSFLLDPEGLKQRERFYIRVHPRTSNASVDGWVAAHDNNWYVKMP